VVKKIVKGIGGHGAIHRTPHYGKQTLYFFHLKTIGIFQRRHLFYAVIGLNYCKLSDSFDHPTNTTQKIVRTTIHQNLVFPERFFGS